MFFLWSVKICECALRSAAVCHVWSLVSISLSVFKTIQSQHTLIHLKLLIYFKNCWQALHLIG